MFSVTKTGTKSLPLCTWKVRPTNSGVIIERRDHVRITCFEPDAAAGSTLLLEARVDERTLLERARHYFFPRSLDDVLVRCAGSSASCGPWSGTPHGVHGWRPPEERPSPPPMGWSTGFIATPRTLEPLAPSQRERPALPMLWFSCSVLPTWPMVAMAGRGSSGARRSACAASRSCPRAPSAGRPPPAARTSCAPLPGFSSIAWTTVPSGIARAAARCRDRISASGPDISSSPTRGRPAR